MSTSERVAALRAFAEKGYHKAKAAKLLGITRTAVGRLCKANGIEMVNKACTRDLTLRRVAAMREMADLDRTATEVSILLSIEPSRVSQIRRDFGITLRKPKQGRPGRLREYILRNIRKGVVQPAVIADKYGTSVNSISATMSTLRKEGVIPPVRKAKPKRISGDLSYFHISSAVNYQKW